jgi:hypothetical protein
MILSVTYRVPISYFGDLEGIGHQVTKGDFREAPRKVVDAHPEHAVFLVRLSHFFFCNTSRVI